MSQSPQRGPSDGDEALRVLSLVERTLTQRLDEALRGCGSGIDQWRGLTLLVERGGGPMNVLGEHAMLLAPKASKLVDRMVAANLVLRRADDEDRRRVLVVASERGRRALAEWDLATAQIRRRFRDALGAEAASFETVLRRLHDELGEATPVPAGTRTPPGPRA